MSASKVPTIVELHEHHGPYLSLRCVAGSQAYGTAGSLSDTDYRGIFMLPREAYLRLAPAPDQVSDDRGDIVYYSLRRYLELAANANPNILEMLFAPEDCIVYKAPEAELLFAHRSLFVTRAAYQSHVSYAWSQVKKSRGQNKWVHNPQPEAPPRREDFCWFVPRMAEGMPYRPVKLSAAGVDLARCHVAALEHTANMFRLYDYGDEARGVFRGGNLVCESIPISDEQSRCIGLLIYNDDAYEYAHREHLNYWKWWNSRNTARWETQLSGEMDYDAKNMMHTFRLLLCGKHIMKEGAPKVRFDGEELELLLDIRAGKFAYDELLKRADVLGEELTALHAISALPNAPDAAEIDALLLEMTDRWEKRCGNA